MVDPKPDLSERGTDFKPYPLDRLTRHATPGSRIATGKYPSVSGLEHDELGHPTANPALHAKMTAKRRDKIKAFGATLPLPEVFGDPDGDVLLVGWGSTWGPVREALRRLQSSGIRVGQLHLRHIHPLPDGLDGILKRYREVIVVEMNDQGLYGFGQLAMHLRGCYALPSIRSLAKTDGLTFKVREIVDGVNARIHRNGGNGHAA
jgi:2-oxoglutarate ferredoxin oxidoreductase subunit alpha